MGWHQLFAHSRIHLDFRFSIQSFIGRPCLDLITYGCDQAKWSSRFFGCNHVFIFLMKSPFKLHSWGSKLPHLGPTLPRPHCGDRWPFFESTCVSGCDAVASCAWLWQQSFWLGSWLSGHMAKLQYAYISSHFLDFLTLMFLAFIPYKNHQESSIPDSYPKVLSHLWPEWRSPDMILWSVDGHVPVAMHVIGIPKCLGLPTAMTRLRTTSW